MRKFILGLAGALALGVCGLAQAASLNVAWDASVSPNVVSYKVYYGNASRAYQSTVAVGPLLTATLSDLPVSARIYIAATATDNVGLESVYSEEIIGYTPVPVVPNFRATNTTQTSITLAWDAPANNINRYVVLYGTTAGIYTQTNNPGASRVAIIGGLSAGQTYYFTIKAINSFDIESQSTLAISATTLGPPAPPTSLRVISGTLQARTQNSSKWITVGDITANVDGNKFPASVYPELRATLRSN